MRVPGFVVDVNLNAPQAIVLLRLIPSVPVVRYPAFTLCGRPEPHYKFCSSARLSVCLSVPYGLLTRKRKSIQKPKLA